MGQNIKSYKATQDEEKFKWYGNRPRINLCKGFTIKNKQNSLNGNGTFFYANQQMPKLFKQREVDEELACIHCTENHSKE